MIMIVKEFHAESSAISEVRFVRNSDEKKGELHIWFKNKFFKAYLNVPTKVFQEFMRAESKGSFFNEKIKGIYPERG